MGTQEKSTVLVVDDNENNIDVLVEALGDDYFVSVAMDGESALEVIEDEPPDLVLLDIMMPGIDGYEVCRRLKGDPQTRDIPVIFITALDEIQSKTTGFELGAVDFITKPFEILEVKARVKTHLSLKLAHQALEIRNRFIRKTFGRYLSDDIVTSILESPEGVALGGEKRVVTLLMSDLRGFTALTENLPAESVVGFINIYLEVMTEVILTYQGAIDEFIGDSILVIFGAPIQRDDHARRAVACALEMQTAMEEVNRRNRAAGYPQVEMGIGINTGELVVGNIGSSKRAKYGVVGRHVNLTSRIESYTVGGQIFVSENTVDSCGSILRIEDSIEVMPKGVKAPITVFDVRGIGGDFNIFLPEKEKIDWEELKQPLSIRFTILVGKYAGDESHQGSVVKLVHKAAEILTETAVDKLADLKISLFNDHGRAVTDDLYAKVIEKISESPGRFRVSFTSVPSEARTFFETLLSPA